MSPAVIAALLLVLLSFGCEPVPAPVPDCHTDTECYEWAVANGWPEEDYP